MSQIYSDAISNYFLGNCCYGNHDINYPSTNWLKCVDTRVIKETFLADMLSLFTEAGWGNIVVNTNWTGSTTGEVLFSATIPGQPLLIKNED